MRTCHGWHLEKRTAVPGGGWLARQMIEHAPHSQAAFEIVHPGGRKQLQTGDVGEASVQTMEFCAVNRLGANQVTLWNRAVNGLINSWEAIARTVMEQESR